MSTGPRTQDSSYQGHQSNTEQVMSDSALLYLFQEVSKLASPIHKSVLETHSASKWKNDTARQEQFTIQREEDVITITNNSCQHSSSCLSPYHIKKVKQETDLVEAFPECNSPLKVLSLINLQCERLLHNEEENKLDQSSVSAASELGDLIDNPSMEISDEAKQGCISRYERQTSLASVNLRKSERGLCSEGANRCLPQDFQELFCVQIQTAGKKDTMRAELVEENVSVSSQFLHTGGKEEKLSVNRLYGWNQDKCLFPEAVILNSPYSDNASVTTLLTSYSNENARKDLSKHDLTLDQNMNLVFTTNLPNDTQPTPSGLLSSQSESLLLSTEGAHRLLSSEDDKGASIPKSTLVPVEETSGLESRPIQEEEIAPSCPQQWRTKTRRKQQNPSRSADIQDPDFKGVMFRMDPELDDSKAQCRLLITSKYSRDLCRRRKLRSRTRTTPKSLKGSSSDEERDLTTNLSKEKVCASCCTRKTPMWRDAEDGTSLCNACGIRYKKYRVRCGSCWHIPRKEGNSNSSCLKCGNFVKLTSSSQRKHSS